MSRIHLIKHQHSFSIFWLYIASYHFIFVSLFILLHITTILVWAEVLTFHCSTYISLHCFSVLRDVEHFISISNYIKLLIAIATIIGVISCDQVIFSLVWQVAHTNHWSQRMYSGSCPCLAILEIYAEYLWNDYWSIYSQSQRFYDSTSAAIMLSSMDCPALSLTS